MKMTVVWNHLTLLMELQRVSTVLPPQNHKLILEKILTWTVSISAGLKNISRNTDTKHKVRICNNKRGEAGRAAAQRQQLNAGDNFNLDSECQLA